MIDLESAPAFGRPEEPVGIQYHSRIAVGRVFALCAALIFTPLFAAGQATEPKPKPLDKLQLFEGEWRGTSKGEPGVAVVERRYELVLTGKFLRVANKSTWAPRPNNPQGEVHEDVGFFSYDSRRKKLVLRQFHVEGFVNQYVEELFSPDGKQFTFVTEAIENIPDGWRARESYRFLGDNEFVERFELAAPGKEFELYSESRLKRVR